MNSGAGLGNLLVLALPLLLLGFLMYSQRKRARQMQEFQAGLAVGDHVVTTAGIYGQIVALEDGAATVTIAPGVDVKIDRRAIGLKQSDPTPPTSDTDLAEGS